MRLSPFEVLLLSLFACFLSFLKFNPCRADEFSAVSTLRYFCYSDIPVFWVSRALEYHTWPFAFSQVAQLGTTINPVEYPVLVGLVIWLISYLTNTSGVVHVNYFDINVIFLSLLFAISSIYLYKIKQKYIGLILFTPAVVMALFINWDMWAVLPTILAIYYFDKGKFIASGIFLSIAVSAKFYPAVLLLPAIIIFLKNKEFLRLKKYLLTFLTTYLILNLPFIISDFKGWRFFFDLSFNRGTGYGSIWEVFTILGINLSNLNVYYSLSSLLVFIIVSLFFWKNSSFFRLHEIAFLFVFAFTLFSKVYSPQYVLWLTPLAILAINSKKQLKAFLLWQILESIYHLAIWRYLYGLGGGQEMIVVSPEIYALISFTRLLTMTFFAWSIMSPVMQFKNKTSN
jgi:uncharacterized membrane protein